MKKIIPNLKNITLACWLVAACLAAPIAQAQFTTNSFILQKGNLTKDGLPYGSGSGYSGVLDGALSDANAAALLTTSPSAGVGNFFKSGSPNGQQQNGFFAYDLTDLKNFITANTSLSSTATVASVSFSIVTTAAASTGGGNYSWGLFGTDPFTSSCTWSNYDGATPWTAAPFQNLSAPNNTVQYGFTGGGSGNTTAYPLLNTNTVFLNGVGAGGALTMSGGTNFLSAVTNALARTDKTLYLTLRIPTFVNGDSRQTLIFSSTNTVASRPQLKISVIVNGTPPASSDIKWVGNISDTWDTSTANWNDGVGATVYANGKNVTFDDTLSISPLNTNITLSSTFSPSNVVAANSTYTYFLTGGGMSGNMNFTKTGGGVFSLGTANTYSGFTTVSSGTLVAASATALGSTISNTVVANGATLTIGNAASGIAVVGESVTLNGPGVGGIRGALRGAVSPTQNIWSGSIIMADSAVRIGTEDNGNITVNGPITDNGSNYVLLYRPGTGGIITISNNAHSYGTTRTFAGNIVMGVNNGFCTNQLQLGTSLVDLNGFVQTVSGIVDNSGAGVITNGSTTVSTLTINSGTNTATTSATMALRGNLNLVKTGPNSQVLGGGTNTVFHSYTGTTTVDGGFLSLSSNLGGVTNDFIVNSGGTLRGSAIIGGNTYINSGGTYYPGSASNNIGTAYFQQNLAFNPGSTMIATINPDLVGSNSFVSVNGTLTYGGNLVIYSIGHTNALQAGQTFRIFPPGGVGSFAATNFNSIEPQPGTTVSFEDGLVTVLSTANPTISVTALGGNQMQISRSSSFYKLQYQTNSLSVGLTDNWADYDPAMTNTQISVTVSNDPAIPATFFRLAPKP